MIKTVHEYSKIRAWSQRAAMVECMREIVFKTLVELRRCRERKKTLRKKTLVTPIETAALFTTRTWLTGPLFGGFVTS